MKTTLQFFFFLCICAQVHAQIVNIPDPVFKQRIIDNGVDTNDDGEIQVTEAEAVTGTLFIEGIENGNVISDLTGIEFFVNITELDCEINALSNIDLSQNTALVRLYCWDNPLTSLNITQCIALDYLEAELTQLTSLDLSNNINLSFIDITDAHLISLDLTNNSNLESISLSNIDSLNFLDIRNGNNTNISALSIHEDPNLTCIFVDDATYMETNFGDNIDSTSHFVETQAECDAAGVLDFEIQHVQIYPNPCKNIFYIKTNQESGIKYSELRVRDVIGRVVYKTILNTENNSIDISSLKKGIYFITIENGAKRILTKKIIKL